MHYCTVLGIVRQVIDRKNFCYRIVQTIFWNTRSSLTSGDHNDQFEHKSLRQHSIIISCHYFSHCWHQFYLNVIFMSVAHSLSNIGNICIHRDLLLVTTMTSMINTNMFHLICEFTANPSFSLTNNFMIVELMFCKLNMLRKCNIESDFVTLSISSYSIIHWCNRLIQIIFMINNILINYLSRISKFILHSPHFHHYQYFHLSYI